MEIQEAATGVEQRPVPPDGRDGVVDPLRRLRNPLRGADRVVAGGVDPVHDAGIGKERVEHARRVHRRLRRATEIEGRGGAGIEVGQVAHGRQPDLARRLRGDGDLVACQVHGRLPRGKRHALARLAGRRVDDRDRVAL